MKQRKRTKVKRKREFAANRRANLPSRIASSESGEPLGLVCVGIEVIADLFRELEVAFVRWVLDGLEELSIASRAAAILGRGSGR
jgi:hypothetical protein